MNKHAKNCKTVAARSDDIYTKRLREPARQMLASQASFPRASIYKTFVCTPVALDPIKQQHLTACVCAYSYGTYTCVTVVT